MKRKLIRPTSKEDARITAAARADPDAQPIEGEAGLTYANVLDALADTPARGGGVTKFVIGLEPGTKKAAWGAVVPDLPGCFGAGDTLDEAIDSAREAIERFCEVLAEDGKEIPAPSALSVHQSNRAYKGWVWAVVEANVERFFGPAAAKGKA